MDRLDFVTLDLNLATPLPDSCHPRPDRGSMPSAVMDTRS